MILLIFGIFAMISGKCPISRHYRLEGDGARWAGLVCIACSLGFFTIFSYPIMAMSQALGLGEVGAIILGVVFQLVVLFTILFALIGIFGNAYAETTPPPMTEEERATALGQIRWFHVVFAIFMPLVAIPWGIVNLLRKKRHSGILLVVVPIIIFVLIFVIALVASMIRKP
jgi:hypothetical protein